MGCLIVIFKKSSNLNLWTRTFLGVIIKRNMEEGKKALGLEDPDVVVENPDETVKKNRKVKKDEPGVNYWGDFINPWTPGYKGYKPWIY